MKQQYPLFFQSQTGEEQIKVISSFEHAYVRCIIRDNGFDYCLAREPVGPDTMTYLYRFYQESSKEKYLEVLRQVLAYTEKLKQQMEPKQE